LIIILVSIAAYFLINQYIFNKYVPRGWYVGGGGACYDSKSGRTISCDDCARKGGWVQEHGAGRSCEYGAPKPSPDFDFSKPFNVD